jgi:PAS domain S-box-containing protein
MHRPHFSPRRIEEIRADAILDAGIGIAVLRFVDDNLSILDANDAFASLAGYDAAGLQDAPFSLLHGVRTNSRVVHEIEDAARHGQPWNDTIVLSHAAGHPLPVRLHISPRTWSDIEGPCVVATMIDATSYVRARNVQRLSTDVSMLLGRPAVAEEQAPEIARAMVRDFADWCAIHLRSPDGTLTLAAIENRTGREPQGTPGTIPSSRGIGKVISSGIPLLHQPMHPENPALSRQMEKIIGEPVHAVASVPIAANSLESFGAITWSITDDQRTYHHEDVEAAEEAGIKFGHYLEEQLIRASLARAVQAREGFMKAAGHELRTPLVSIKGYTQLLLRDFRRQTISPERLEAGLKAIDTATSRLTDLMEDLFAVSNPGLTSLPLRLVTVDLRHYIREFLATTPSLVRAGHRFHVKDPDEVLKARVDLTRFSQVLFNVVINAVHFSPPETDITIETRKVDGSALISVHDSGRGLAPGEEISIFDPFTQPRDWHDSDEQGLGIGLYISKQIVTRHKGEIWAQSDGADQGTTINIRLPIEQSDDE